MIKRTKQKTMLTEASVLKYCDLILPVKLRINISKRGLGAVLL